MEIKDRMDEYRAVKNLSDKSFEKMIGSSNGAWRKARTVSEDILLGFLHSFPEVNAEWLLRGKGKMTLNDNESTAPANDQLLGLCKSLVKNYQQRDVVMSQLVSMVKKIDE